MACENCGTIGYYNSSHWNGDSTDYCCNDGNDYRRTRLASVTMDNGYSSDTNDKACCLASNDCVDDGQCTDTTQRKDADADGDQDYCNAGTWVDCMNSGDCQSGQTCQSNDCVSANYLTVESTILSFLDQGKWIESVNVPPIAGGNRQMNVTVIVKNSTTINTCSIRIFNSSGSYSNPTIGPLSGTFRTVGSQIQCYRLWDMEYWRNSGQWNVSVSLSDTVSNFTSKNFTYASLVSLDINVSTIDFSGYPGDRVNSINSYPLGINNTGNTVLTVSINGTDFIGQTDANYKIRVNNITYSKDKSVFTQLMSNQQLVYSNLYPKDNKPIYFNMSIPIGYLNQNYQNNININATG